MEQDRTRGLGVTDASLLVVGSIVGAGIFLVSGEVAQLVRSPAAFLATWVLGGAVALAGALSNGELGGLFPRSGGEYVYLREAYGPSLGFLSGWTSFWIAFPGSIASLAAGLGATVAPMLGMPSAWAPRAVGALAIGALTAINALGLRPGKWTQNVLSVVKLIAFLGLLALGALVRRPGPSGLVPFFVPGDHAGGIATALIPVLFAYSGWNAATYVAGEMRDPKKALGRALVLGTTVCIALYLAINLTYLRAMPVADLARTERAGARRGACCSAVTEPRPVLLAAHRRLRAELDAGVGAGGAANLSRHGERRPLLRAARQGPPHGRRGCRSSRSSLRGGLRRPAAERSLRPAGPLHHVGDRGLLHARGGGGHRPTREATDRRASVSRSRLPIGARALCRGQCVDALERSDLRRRSSPREALIGLAIVATGVPAYAAFRARPRPPETLR